MADEVMRQLYGKDIQAALDLDYDTDVLNTALIAFGLELTLEEVLEWDIIDTIEYQQQLDSQAMNTGAIVVMDDGRLEVNLVTDGRSSKVYVRRPKNKDKIGLRPPITELQIAQSLLFKCSSLTIDKFQSLEIGDVLNLFRAITFLTQGTPLSATASPS